GGLVGASVVRKTEEAIGVDRVGALVLQGVGPDLVRQPDPPPLLPEVEDDPGAPANDLPHGAVELGPAIAFERAEDLPRDALAVDPHDHPLLSGWLAVNQGEVLASIALHGEDEGPELAVAGGKGGLGEDGEWRNGRRPFHLGRTPL